MANESNITTLIIKITVHTAQPWEIINSCLNSIASAFFTSDDTIIKTHNFERYICRMNKESGTKLLRTAME